MAITVPKRIKKLKERGVLTDGFMTDRCIDCKHSNRIVVEYNGSIELFTSKGGERRYVCTTGCNGYPEFTQNTGGSRTFTGKQPLKHEQEEDVEI